MSTFPKQKQETPIQIARAISLRQNSGAAARNLLAPPPPSPPPTTTLAATSPHNNKKQPKNHVSINRQKLKQMQKQKRQSLLRSQQEQQEKENRMKENKKRQYGNVPSKLYNGTAARSYSPASCYCDAASSVSSSSTQAAVIVNRHARANDNDCDGNTLRMKGARQSLSSSSQQQQQQYPPKIISSAISTDRHQHRSNNNSGSNTSDCTQKHRHKSFGKIPSYILQRRITEAETDLKNRQRQRQLQNDDDDEADTSPPPVNGMVRLSEKERVETLALLQDNRDKTQKELLRLPLASGNSIGMLKKRETLERKMKEIHEAIDIFKQTKVYIEQ
mmetsp:Transcript_34555/g.42262  ORF Transcript_34555/g.42262 Transcript_34555/m.42262 type:complete len:332 (+) Transcript_34555:180-1175(+)